MVKIPEPQHTLAALVDAAVERHDQENSKPRSHMGASMLGHDCERYLWLSFRWAFKNGFSGRMLRLFKRGQDEELSIVRYLKMAGLQTEFTELDHKQKRVELGGHVSGSMDGIVNYGVPQAPQKKHVLEIKTHNDKSFKLLLKDGVEKSKFQHFVQMQVYMHGEGIDRALYVAINKNDDTIYTERVRYKKTIAEKYIEKGKRISLTQSSPLKISEDKTFYKCKWCDAKDVCHNKLTTEVNCRTCAYIEPTEEGDWYCHHWKRNIPTEWQYEGCPNHGLNPELVPWDFIPDSDNGINWVIDGKTVNNGADGYSSHEILANANACAHGDDFTDALRKTFDARVIE
jgi:hypothetical protein